MRELSTQEIEQVAGAEGAGSAERSAATTSYYYRLAGRESGVLGALQLADYVTGGAVSDTFEAGVHSVVGGVLGDVNQGARSIIDSVPGGVSSSPGRIRDAQMRSLRDKRADDDE